VTDAERIAALERQLAERDARIAALEAQVAMLLARVDELTRQLGQNSSNSSKPPSADGPAAPRQAPRKPSGKKRGAQPGHKGHHRVRVPSDQVDHVVEHKPPTCGDCGVALAGDDPEPMRHQVTELPPVRAEVTEHRLHALTCGDCGATTCATLPPEVPRGAFGPRLTALTATLTGVYHVGRRTAQGLLRDWFGVAMALGSVIACERVVSAALERPVADAHAYVKDQPVVHADETGWRQALARAWLWVAVTTHVTVFVLHTRRGVEGARALLGAFTGWLVTDRWSAYNAWAVERRQLCWAHLLRYWVSFTQYSNGKVIWLGKQLLEHTDAMFKSWHRVRDGTLTRAAFQAEMVPRRAAVEGLLTYGTECGNKRVAGICRAILKRRVALWTFVDVPGIEPTNNAAERAMRQGVVWRRLSLGTQSDAGSRFVERILTTAVTLRQQGRSIVGFLTAAVAAKYHSTPAPSLLPTTSAPAPLQAAA
jgi:transposase